MSNTITLTKGFTAWLATYSEDIASEIRSAFGTATLPTAFTSEANSQGVKLCIEKLHPGVTVIIKE